MTPAMTKRTRTMNGAMVALLSLGTIHAQPQQTLVMTTPPPAAVVQASGVYTGQSFSGSQPVCYFVVARYPVGATPPFGPICVPNSPGIVGLDATRFITITWQAVAGASTYDVVRSSTSSYPLPCVDCAVGVGLTATLLIDNGITGVAYPNTGYVNAVQASAVIRVENREKAIPQVQLAINGGAAQQVPTVVGVPLINECAKFDADGNILSAGTSCGSPAGSITTAAASFATGDPIIGAAGATPIVAAGTRSGNTTVFATVSGATTLGRCAQWGSTGNLIESASACGTGTTIAPPYNSSDGGTTFWGPAWQLRKPNSYGAWTQNNWGASTVVVTNGAFTLTFPSNAAVANVRSYTSPLPGGSSWTAEFLYAKTGPARNNEYCGVGVRESATSKMVWVGAQGTNPVQVMNYTNDTTRTSTSFSLSWTLPSVSMWVRIIRSGATLSYELGSDPLNYFMLFSGATTVFFTTAPDQLGVFCDVNNGSSGPVYMNLLSAFAQ